MYGLNMIREGYESMVIATAAQQCMQSPTDLLLVFPAAPVTTHRRFLIEAHIRKRKKEKKEKEITYFAPPLW